MWRCAPKESFTRTHHRRVGCLPLLGAVGANKVTRALERERGGRWLLDARLGAAATTFGWLLAAPRVVALQARAAAALVPIEARQVVKAAALLAEALALALPYDAIHLCKNSPGQAPLSACTNRETPGIHKIQPYVCVPTLPVQAGFKVASTLSQEMPHGGTDGWQPSHTPMPAAPQQCKFLVVFS